ncbi:MAG TPA: metalloregulator ArsR/SmtB family transcription factor [Kineosporiaceae bacterium]
MPGLASTPRNSNAETAMAPAAVPDGPGPELHPDSGELSLDRETAETYASWFQALSDPTRIMILSYLSRRPAAVSVGTIVNDLGIGQSTVSHHLKALLDVGFVSRTRDRTSRLYAVNRNCVTRFPVAADAVMGVSDHRNPGP